MTSPADLKEKLKAAKADSDNTPELVGAILGRLSYEEKAELIAHLMDRSIARLTNGMVDLVGDAGKDNEDVGDAVVVTDALVRACTRVVEAFGPVVSYIPRMQNLDKADLEDVAQLVTDIESAYKTAAKTLDDKRHEAEALLVKVGLKEAADEIKKEEALDPDDLPPVSE